MVLSQYPIGETQPWATAASLYRTTFLKCPKLPLIFDGVRQPPAPLQGKRYCHLSMSRSRMVRMPLRKLRERREREKGRQSRPAALYTAFISKFHQIGPSTSAVRGGRAGGANWTDELAAAAAVAELLRCVGNRCSSPPPALSAAATPVALPLLLTAPALLVSSLPLSSSCEGVAKYAM